jgi:sialate O-acetylesterase
MKKILVIFIIAMATVAMGEKQFRKEIDLSGEWYFEIGSQSSWAQRSFDHSVWEKVNVPDKWENQGFPGYDGQAWYRKNCIISSKYSNRQIYLLLGRIDDVDETFINGHKLGTTGSFPPQYQSAWEQRRIYAIPTEWIRYGQSNTIAVHVYDAGGIGGIYDGDIGIFISLDAVDLQIDLSGPWLFHPGDDSLITLTESDARQWETINVPGTWEKQGYGQRDGICWYRKDVIIDKKLAQHKLILFCGRIDDRDEVYVNGLLIGQTGLFSKTKQETLKTYRKERIYFIPSHLIRVGKPNSITIRVLDHGGLGGIYEGPIGIATREEYLRYGTR